MSKNLKKSAVGNGSGERGGFASTIVMTGGGTAGHVTPLLAVAENLKNYNRIVYVGSGKPAESEIMKKCDAVIENTNPPKLIRGVSLKNFVIPVKLYKSIKTAEEILKKYNPSVVFSKGGYCALPVCLAAAKLKIPIICHESDITAGLANRLIFKKCDKIFTSFAKTASEYGGVCSGPPMRGELNKVSKTEAKKFYKITDDRPVLLVTGGSQGSLALNDAVTANFAVLTKQFNVIHQCGKGKIPAYKPINGYYVCELTDMGYALAACDVVLSRGGSNTLFEALNAGKAILCCPLEKGSRGDQLKNAEYFAEKNALAIIYESELTDKLPIKLREVYSKREFYAEHAAKLKTSGGEKIIAKALDEYAKN